MIDASINDGATMKLAFPLTLLALAFSTALMVGCSGNATNEPSVAAIEDANAKRAAAVDNDPLLTPAQKAEMKSHMNLGKAGDQTKGR